MIIYFKIQVKNIRNAVSLNFEANYLKNIDKNIFNAITRYNFFAALLLLNKKLATRAISAGHLASWNTIYGWKDGKHKTQNIVLLVGQCHFNISQS